MTADLLTPEFGEREVFEIGDWHPTRYTPSLSGDENFPSAGDRLIAAAPLHFRAAGVPRFQLDEWQKWLIRHALEVYPADWPVEHLRGQLRYRQVVISMGRQNGKSLLAALFIIWGLTMHVGGPSVVGFASSEKQAKIVYKRVAYAVKHSPGLRRLLHATKTQGITRRDGAGEYDTIPADEDAAQGIPITFGLGDELHLTPAGLWAAIVNGQRAQASSILVGITTAGDEDSELLLSLYGQIDDAIAGKHERLGGFIWEAPEGSTIDDDAAIIAANPSIACGRIDLAQVKTDAALQPEPDQQRYLFNRFIASTNAWAPMRFYSEAPQERVLPTDPGVVLAYDRTPDWTWASVWAFRRTDDGRLVASLVASIPKPSHNKLVALAEQLEAKSPGATHVMDGLTLKKVGKALEVKGLNVQLMTLADVVASGSTAYANLARANVSHGHDQLLERQWKDARRKNVGEAWRLSRDASGGDIDSVVAFTFGLYAADTTDTVPTVQVF